MSTLLFIIVLSCLAIVLIWYVKNEDAGASGETGFLAIKTDGSRNEAGVDGEAYRIKSPSASEPTLSAQHAQSEQRPAYRTIKDRRGFRAVSTNEDDEAS